MSMLTYLASSVQLPVGEFSTHPDAIYENYAAYRQSKDYVKPKNIGMPPPYDFSRKLYQSDCPVHVYRRYAQSKYIRIFDYEKEDSPTRIAPRVGESELSQEMLEQNVLSQDVSGQFTLPYIYYLGMGCDETALRECLCAHLKPGGKAELYEVWACTEREERDRAWDRTVDLQTFIDSGNIDVPETEYAEESEKRFVTYLSPQNGSIVFDYAPNNKDVILVYADKRLVVIPYSLAEKALGKFQM